MLAHKDGDSQDFLIYKPDERIWIHLNLDEEYDTMDLLKDSFVFQMLGQLYFVGINSTSVFKYEEQVFQQRNNLVNFENIKHLSIIYMK